MKPPPTGDEAPADSLARQGFLTSSIRRDVSDLNRQYLDLALEPALVADPRVALPEEIRPALLDGGDALLTRLASSPFTLFEVSLGLGSLGGHDRAAGVEDAKRPPIDLATTARVQSFANVAVFLAWRLADGEPLAFRIVFGLSPTDELRLNQARPTDLPRLASAPGLIRPRFARQPRFWRLLVRAASTGSEATLQRVHCAGLCTVIADLPGPDGRPTHPGGRGRR